MNLIIDIGNTNTKAAVFDNQQFIENFVFSGNNRNSEVVFNHLKEKYPSFSKTIISSVVGYDNDLVNTIKSNINHCICLNSETSIPIGNTYKTKNTLGNDRIAAAVGANLIFPDENILIIDIGTAITYDIVDSSNCFVGGTISPGMLIRFKGLNQYTKKLPLLNPENEWNIYGTTTHEAILSGVQNGILYEMEGYINHFSLIYSNLKTIFTGGDIFFFVKKLKNIIFAEPNLIFIGLNRILNYNVEN